MKKTNNLSIALLSKNPSEEKSLCKKLDEIDKMKHKVRRESAEKMTNFAIQHLNIVKYYDANNREQCRPRLKIAQNSVCSLPRLTGERKQQPPHMYKESTSLPKNFARSDCATARPSYHRSLSDKALSFSEVNLSDEKESFASAQTSKPKRGRSISEIAPPKSVTLGGSAKPVSTAGNFHAWAEKEDERNRFKVNNSDPAFKRKYSRSLCFAPSKLALFQPQERKLLTQDLEESSEKVREGTDAGKWSGIHNEGDKGRRRLQRRVTVSGETPSITREFCRWQKTVKLVKDLPKSEQAEIFRGACFFRMPLPSRYVPPHKPNKAPVERQRKVSTVTEPCRQELSPSTLY